MQNPSPTTAIILLAAGRATRMQGTVHDKILAPLAGQPVFCYSLNAFVTWGGATTFVIVYRDIEQRETLERLCAPAASGHTVLFVQGGQERRDSVNNALAALPEDIHHVYIHDCARPLLRPQWLSAMATELQTHPAVTLAHPVTDTIKIAPTATPATPPGSAHTTLWADVDRSRLWAVETPQAFLCPLLQRAYAHALSHGLPLTDDTAAVAALGTPVCHLHPDGPNWKITTPADISLLEYHLAQHPTR